MNRVSPAKIGLLILVLFFIATFIGTTVSLLRQQVAEEQNRRLAAEAAARQAAEQKQADAVAVRKLAEQKQAAEAERVLRERQQVLQELQRRQREREVAERRMVLQDEERRRREQEERVENERRRREEAQRAADAHAQFLARYENTSYVRPTGKLVVAVAAAGENRTANDTLGSALAEHLKGDAFQLVPSFFHTAFIADEMFDRAFDGSAELFNNLELTRFLDGLLLAREKIRYKDNPSLENVITANVELEVTLQPLGSQMHQRRWVFTANGAGFHKTEALQLAEERLAKQISLDTKMSLN